jgi:hypothetical protein
LVKRHPSKLTLVKLVNPKQQTNKVRNFPGTRSVRDIQVKGEERKEMIVVPASAVRTESVRIVL